MENLKEISTVDLVNELKHRRCVGLSVMATKSGYSRVSITIKVPTLQTGEIFNTRKEIWKWEN